MEDDNIPKLFKHRWLNITLRFIKNDDQTVLEYPEMPIAHMDYLHCIWQHQNIEPDFKSLYKFLKEAMSIFSVKYKFEVTKHLLGDVGKLKIQKIPRTDPQPQGSKPSSGNLTQRITKPKQPSKTQKYVAATKKIIETISPPFIRNNFQKILDFIKDKASASLTFTDLAPIEASLLQEFLGIYNRKEAFSEFFSPACNNILEKMSVAFKEFDRNTKLEICVVKTDMNTRKREITYLKVPRYTNNTTSKAKLRQNVAEKTKTAVNEDRKSNNQELKYKDLHTENVETNKKSNLGKSDTIINREINIKENKPINNNINKTTTDKGKTITAIDTKTSVSKNTDNTTINNNDNGKVTKDNNTRAVLNNNTNNNSNNNTAIDKKIDVKECKPIIANGKKNINNNDNSKSNCSSNVSKSIKNTTIDNKGNIQVTLSIDTKSINNDSKADNKDKVTKDNNKVDSEAIDTITENKSKKKKEKGKKLDKQDFLKDANEINEIRKKLPKQTILFAKANEGLTDEEITEKYKFQRSTQKNKLLEAMSTPLKSGKGLRMMKLMGWEGGALGIRGEGIVEPLIPELNHMSGAGLGHAAERHTRKQDRHVIRMEFLENILNLVEKNLSVTIISYKDELSKKDRRFFNEMILMFNKRKNSLAKQQSEIGDKIVSKMEDGQISLDITLSKCNKLITLRNLKHTGNCEQTINENVSLKKKIEKKENKAKVTMTTNKAQFRELVFTKVLELLKSENDFVMLDFDGSLSSKYCQFVRKVCDRINKRRRLPVLRETYEMCAKEIVYHTGDSYLTLEFGEDLQSLTIRKLKENPISTDNILRTKDDNNNTKDLQVNVANKIIKPLIILIKPTNYIQFAKTVTNLITDKIEMEDNFVPLLKSHGIQNGFLVYSCANKISYLWLKDVLNDYNVIDYRGTDNKYVVQIKVKAYMDVDKVLLLLDKYNNGLDVSKWRVSEQFLVKMDVESFEYICNNNFRLNAGVDQVEFNIHYVNT